MTNDDQVDVAIVGAGISGLACAFACRSLGMRVAVFEEAGEPGGCIKTIQSDGCMIEGGPQSYLSSPAISGLVDALGLRGEVVATSAAAKRRYVLTRRGLIAVPSSPPALIFSPLLTARAKWRLMCEPFVAMRTGEDDESVASFVRRRAGHEIVDVVAGPFLAGINAGDPEKISVQSTFPALAKMEREHGSILRALRNAGVPKERPASFSFRLGNRALTVALAASLGQSVALRSPVERIEITTEGVSLSVGGDRRSVVRAKHTVVAVAAGAAARLIAPFAADAAREVSAIEYAPVVQLALVYPRTAIEVPLDGYGFLAARDAGVRILGAVWNSAVFPNRSAKDDFLVTAFFGGAGDRAVTIQSDDELVARTHDDLAKAMKIVGVKPRALTVFRWNPGIPQYNLGHDARLRSIDVEMARIPAVALCGNYMRGVSVSDCVRQAGELALRLSRAAS